MFRVLRIIVIASASGFTHICAVSAAVIKAEVGQTSLIFTRGVTFGLQKFGVVKMFLKDITYSDQGCNYLIQNTVKQYN